MQVKYIIKGGKNKNDFHSKSLKLLNAGKRDAKSKCAGMGKDTGKFKSTAARIQRRMCDVRKRNCFSKKGYMFVRI